MQTIQAIAIVTDDGELTLRMPKTIAPGPHQVVLVVDEEAMAAADQSRTDFPVVDIGVWPDDFSLRREDLYDDDIP